jgi:hypothetical protein
VIAAQQVGDRCGLHELGSVADYRGDSHLTTDRIMTPGVTTNLFQAAASAVRHLAWYVGYTAGSAPPRDL